MRRLRLEVPPLRTPLTVGDAMSLPGFLDANDQPEREHSVDDAIKTIEYWRRHDPVAFFKMNFFQQRLRRAFLDIKPQQLTIILALKPNRVGGTHGIMQILSAIKFGSANNPDFQGPPFGKHWPFLKAGRIVSTAENLADVGALQLALKAAFPVGKYEQSRGAGKGYNSACVAPEVGWNLDAYTFGQDALAAAGKTLGIVVDSEPLPKALYSECLTRLSGNGVMAIECVQMDLAPYLEELAEDCDGKAVPLELYIEDADGSRRFFPDPVPRALLFGSLKLDGRVVGEVRVVRGDVEDACAEHCNGHMTHSAIEAMVAGWPAEEREARRTGKPMKLSGRIYPNWNEENEIEEVPEWHRKQWDDGNVVVSNLLDPHDAKPWALGWFATYPNDDVILFQEWPDFDFAATKQSPITELEDYRAIINSLDLKTGRVPDNWIIDKLFGNTPGKGTSMTLKKMLAKPCRACLRHVGRAEYEDLDERSEAYLEAERNCKHRISYSDGVAYKGSVNEGHILVRDLLGGKGKRPKLFALKPYTPNFCKGMRRYAWALRKEGANAEEKPELINKDFPDLVANLVRKKLHIYPKEAPPPPKIEDLRSMIARARAGTPPAHTPTITPRDGRPRTK